ncbi:unnamed protein product [Lymnaea stagnalis]|uniref:RING-type domain-containing protein n=1 Tax=Lymnaea stagnalis TaxID=6523 RepID=A0AAV2IGC7_LYMST
MATGLRCDNVPFSVHSEATYRDNVSGGNGGVLIQGRRASQDRSEDVALDPATGARRSGSQAASVSQAERAPSRGSTPRSFTNQGEGQDENPPMDLQQNSHRVLPSFPSRMESFIDTSFQQGHQTPLNLAKAGFFYSGIADVTICFKCGIRLRHWQQGENVWIEHARWSPTCPHLLKILTRGVIDAVQKLHVSMGRNPVTITFNMVARVIRESKSQICTDESWQASPASGVTTVSPASDVPIPSTASDLPVASPASGVPVASTASCVPIASHASGVPIASTASGVPIASPASGVPIASTASGVPIASPDSGVPIASPSIGVPIASAVRVVTKVSPATCVTTLSTASGVTKASSASGVPVASPATGVPIASPASGVPTASHARVVTKASPATCVTTLSTASGAATASPGSGAATAPRYPSSGPLPAPGSTLTGAGTRSQCVAHLDTLLPDDASQLIIKMTMPRHEQYTLNEHRRSTYSRWPSAEVMSPDHLSSSGFFYTGQHDCIVCFLCGCKLKGLQTEDSVQIEHALRCPGCPRLRLQMSQCFVDTVQSLARRNDHEIISVFLSREVRRESSPLNLCDRLREDPAVRAVRELGYPMEHVLEIAQSLKMEGPFSAKSLLEKISSQRNTIGIDTTLSTREWAAISSRQPRNAQTRHQFQCKICLVNEVAAIFLPCGHLVSCELCATELKNTCPICRGPINYIVPFYFRY